MHNKDAGTPSFVLAVPSTGEGGLGAGRSSHFGRCDCFTVVEVEDGEIGSVRVLVNPPHSEQGCLAPVDLLATNGVTALLVAGIGGRPLARCRTAGIEVFFDRGLDKVGEAVDAFRSGAVSPIQAEWTCKE